MTSSNPALASWNDIPYGLPPFAKCTAAHYEEALKASMEENLAELAALVANPEKPTFANTIASFDRLGGNFTRINDAFSNLCLSLGTPEYQDVELRMAGPLAEHGTAIYTYPGLFERVAAVYAEREQLESMSTESGVEGAGSAEARVLTERIYLDMVRSGALLSASATAEIASGVVDGPAAAKAAEYKSIVTKLAEKTTVFAQNVLRDEGNVFLPLTADQLSGLPADVIAASKQAAKDLAESGVNGNAEKGEAPAEYVVTLSRSLVVPFLTYSTERELRKQAWKLWTDRGDLTDGHRNLPLAAEILALRSRLATLHGYETYSAFRAADAMAQTPAAIENLLKEVWNRAKPACNREREELAAYAANELPAEEAEQMKTIEAWDWRYLAEKLRVHSYDLDASAVKPYFSLRRMTEAIFDCAGRLFGVSFKKIDTANIPMYHPDVDLYEVYRDDKLVAIFLHDNFARPHKRGGAWMSHFRAQHRNTGKPGEEVIPIIINNNNFNKPAPGEDCLLSFDDTITLFHEFGHGLHGMLSDVTYSRLSGTNVLLDFVELPSQLFEHWVKEPKVMEKHAVHHLTGEPIPPELFAQLMRANRFHMGFQTVEYLASALVDARIHSLPAGEYGTPDAPSLDLVSLEKSILSDLEMPAAVVMRHRLPHFLHLFSSEGYAASYYVYQWAEVLDADAFARFTEAGDCFDPTIAASLLKNIYSAGASRPPMDLFREFRGREPQIDAMLRKKGLL